MFMMDKISLLPLIYSLQSLMSLSVFCGTPCVNTDSIRQVIYCNDSHIWWLHSCAGGKIMVVHHLCQCINLKQITMMVSFRVSA